MVRIAGKDPVNAFIRLAGEWSPRLGAELLWRQRRQGLSRQVVEDLVCPGMTVLDIGASKGAYTNRMARLVGHRGHVHAFEPDPESAKAVSAIATDYPGTVTLHQLALSDRVGSATLHVPMVKGRRSPGLSRLSQRFEPSEATQHEEVAVRIDRLDSVLGSEAAVAFIKCDVEGHEYQVLKGAQEILSRSRPAVLVEIEQRHQERDIRETFEYLRWLGYVGYAIGPNALVPLVEFDVRRDQLQVLESSSSEREHTWEDPAYINDFLFVVRPDDVAHLFNHGSH